MPNVPPHRGPGQPRLELLAPVELPTQYRPARGHFVATPRRHGRCEFAAQGGHDDFVRIAPKLVHFFSTGLKTPALPSLHQARVSAERLVGDKARLSLPAVQVPRGTSGGVDPPRSHLVATPR